MMILFIANCNICCAVAVDTMLGCANKLVGSFFGNLIVSASSLYWLSLMLYES